MQNTRFYQELRPLMAICSLNPPGNLAIVSYSQHYCTRCRKYFNADVTDLAAPGSHSTKRVVDTAVRLVIEDG